MHGRVEGEVKRGDDSRSAWRYEAIREMLSCGVEPETILGVLTDPQYAISARAIETSDPEEYARGEIRRVQRKRATERAEAQDQAQIDFADFVEDNAALNRLVQRHNQQARAAKRNKVARLNRFKATTYASILELPEPEFLLNGLIAEQSLTLLFGKRKSGKTFWSLSLGLAIACGIDHYGRKVEPGKVIHVVAEGNIRKLGHRVTAWIMENSANPKERLKLERAIAANWRKLEVPVLINVSDQVSSFITANCDDGPYSLIILDTLMRTFSGNMSEQSDMAKYVQGCDLIREQLQAAVMVVHHPGHGDATRAAGSINLDAAVDGIFKFARDGKTPKRTFEVVELRDGDPDEFPKMTFELKTHVTAIRQYDEPSKPDVKSAVLVEAAPVVDESLSDEDRLLIRIHEEKPKEQKELWNEEWKKSTVSRQVKSLREAEYLEPESLKATKAGLAYIDVILPKKEA